MRSRNTRSFTVELKSKRRTSSDLSSSIWGNTASFLKAPPEPVRPSLFQKSAAPVLTKPSVSVVPEADKQPKRVLPDLRAVESLPPEEVRPIRVTRSRKGGRRT